MACATIGLKKEFSHGATNVMNKITIANWMNQGLALGPKIGSFCITMNGVS